MWKNWHDSFTLLNSFNSNLNFTVDYNGDKGSFSRYVGSKKKNTGILTTTLCREETDEKKTLFYWCAVLIPPHWREFFPKVSFFRLKRVCNTTDDFVPKSWRHESEICPASVSYWLDWRGLWDCTKKKKKKKNSHGIVKKKKKKKKKQEGKASLWPISPPILHTVMKLFK